MYIRTLALALVGLALSSEHAFGQGTSVAPAPPMAVQNVTVVDAKTGTLIPNQTVVIEGGRIVTVGPAQSTKPPSNATVIDGAEKYLIPGLWDMHVHAAWEGLGAALAPLFVVHGVTGVREMFGGMDAVKAWKANYEAGQPWPRMLGAGHILDGPRPIWPGSARATNAEEARRAVDSLHDAGADFIKVYGGVPHDAYVAAMEEAKKVGTYVVGHVPDAVSVSEASDLGQRSIEHLNGIGTECSSVGDSLRAERVAASQDSTANMMAVFSRQMGRVLESYDSSRCEALYAKLAQNHTWQVPTLVVLRSVSYLDDKSFTADPRVRYMPEDIVKMWDPANDFRFSARTPESWATAKQLFQRSMKTVGALHRAGVPIMAGTDMLNPYCFPGFSLHDELGLLVEAGLSPAEALKAATWNPVEFLGLTDSLGSVATGKRADLVLLHANPLENINNSKTISDVILNGRLYTRAALDSLLEAAARP